MELRDAGGDEHASSEPFYYALLLTVNVTLTVIVLLAACLWCKRQATKDDLGGLEGMVKMTNPDDVVVVKVAANSESRTDLNVSAVSNTDSEKRASTAAHRSLPDIPVGDANCDNGSELYETVADKRLLDEGNDRNKSPTPSLKKQTSVSQHSSISQADDVSSPYSRVRNPPHDYAKVRNTEHPYAQVNPPSASAAAAAAAVVAAGNSNNAIYGSQPPQLNGTHSRNSNHSNTSQNESPSQAEIPAASAIAGMISASQDLPYMTPPITNQHFSGDSQDSSSYTSISVREPLANILAQQPPKPTQRIATLTRDASDSHYATVSDDSDETYAAIEDPNIRGNPNVLTDIYTSGSETYAQIQPLQMSSMVVSVEINNTNNSSHNINANTVHAHNVQSAEYKISNTSTVSHHHQHGSHTQRPISEHATPVPPPVDSLRTQKHSRQPSSSSNNSSLVCNLGSPKPEKRQANSPLPPTPKSNITSCRSSVISVIECGGGAGDFNPSGVITATSINAVTAASATTNTDEVSPQKNKSKSLSPSKDIEGMYAKVMKKNKLSRHSPSSQNNSPVMTRKYGDNNAALGISPLDMAAAELMETNRVSVFNISNATSDKGRIRSNSYGSKDHGYETIPADAVRPSVLENRKSDCYSSLLRKERPKEIVQIPNPPAANAKPPINSDVNSDKHYETIAVPLDTTSNSDPGYETLQKPNKLNQSDPDNEKKSSDYDPNYEVLERPKSAGLSDDGYAKINEKKHLALDDDSTDGYSKVKGEECDDGATGGYSTIGTDANHNYASIAETKEEMCAVTPYTEDSDHYARIAEAPRIPQSASELPLSALHTPTGKLALSVSVASGVTQDTLAITSPSSINSSSLLANSSTLSSTNALTGSSSTTSTISSRQTPSTSSQYESLTGSETDPNYESVCYPSTGRENPYERLQTEYSDTQLSSSSPITPDELRQQQKHKKGNAQTHKTTTTGGSTSASSPATTVTNSDSAAATIIAAVPLKTTPNGLMPKARPDGTATKVQKTSELNATDVVVDDYFQV
ncbi:PREDICTED: serine-rich adhesin for platelets isoform X2 [Rhagoletis zephyria]|uniref:serine-rich adhesin for platelets isoform X2 n=1 Tax=Rhagoletis zephyria TaxID=28612 RepID=UPI0008114719|nr:PREDICTED: serine-rich adhesin for platelets isoform X2 [Rhagoletis zephyria]